jgi:vancomycin permeability regulator SanA
MPDMKTIQRKGRLVAIVALLVLLPYAGFRIYESVRDAKVLRVETLDHAVPKVAVIYP